MICVPGKKKDLNISGAWLSKDDHVLSQMGQLWPQGSTIGQQVIHVVLIASVILDLQLDLGMNVGGKSEGAERG